MICSTLCITNTVQYIQYTSPVQVDHLTQNCYPLFLPHFWPFLVAGKNNDCVVRRLNDTQWSLIVTNSDIYKILLMIPNILKDSSKYLSISQFLYAKKQQLIKDTVTVCIIKPSFTTIAMRVNCSNKYKPLTLKQLMSMLT